MFKQAARLKFRFMTRRGQISVEDLFDLPLSTNRADGLSLDTVAIGVSKDLKATGEESFVHETTPQNTIEQLRLDIVKEVIAIKKRENAAKLETKAKSEQKKKLLALIAEKSDEDLKGKSLAELTAMVEAL